MAMRVGRIREKFGVKWRRGVQFEPVTWPGWRRILWLYENAPAERHRRAFLAIFFGGFRVSEAIQLQRRQIAIGEDAIVIYSAPVLKYKRRMMRDVLIPNDPENPLFDEYLNYLKHGFKKIDGKWTPVYLIPKTQRFTSEVVPDKPASRKTVWRWMLEIDESLFPHLLRSWWAAYLVNRFDFRIPQLQKYFAWKNADVAAHYVKPRLRELAEKLGVRRIPTLEV